MEYIYMLILTVVLVAQIVLFVLYFLEKHHSKHRFNAMLQYIDRRIEDADFLDEFEENVNERFKRQSEEIFKKIDSLAVSYAEAQQAADKVNEFATGLASIFDYDPLVAIKKGRNKEAG